MTTRQEFEAKFSFREDRSLFVGVERECFLTRNDKIVPIAKEVVSILQLLGGKNRFSYELSACQLEDRIGPVEPKRIERELCINEGHIALAEKERNFQRLFVPVAPMNMPLDIYPDPTGRYAEITKNMSHEVLRAACRVIGIHVHIGMPNKETAIRVYNKVIKHCTDLGRLGGSENKKRLYFYRVVAPRFMPQEYKDWEDFYKQAVLNNFADNPRNCWHLIRISVHGTIEFRMFPSTENLRNIDFWAKFCHHLCRREMY